VDPCASVVAAEPVTSIDVTSADVLAELEDAAGIRHRLRFAEMKDPVTHKLKRFELFEYFGAASFHQPWAPPSTLTSKSIQ
jgi:hypothetical protein